MDSLILRRPLHFDSLKDAVADAELLHQGGYTRAGNWDLAQCCNHLAQWMSFPIEGTPPLPLPMKFISTAVRLTIGPGWLRKMLATNKWPENVPTDGRTIPPAGGDESAAVMKLRAASTRLQYHEGGLQPSPIFGSLDKETWLQLHLLHAAHHLSFLVPAGK